MLKIGFVDHHLNNYHANKFLSLLHGPLADLDAGVTAAWESDATGDDWCAKNGISRLESAEAVARECDAVIVLAPDNIDAHASLCPRVFPAGKPVFIDKLLATGVDEGRDILQQAKVHGVPVFSASSLRYAVELEAALADAGTGSEAFGRGMGAWNGYGVHTVSMVLRALGDAAPARVIHTGTEHSAVVTVETADARRGWIDVRTAANEWDAFPWTFGFRVGERYVTGQVKEFDGFYANLMRRTVEFFKTATPPLTSSQLLAPVAVLEGANRSRERGGEWVALDLGEA